MHKLPSVPGQLHLSSDDKTVQSTNVIIANNFIVRCCIVGIMIFVTNTIPTAFFFSRNVRLVENGYCFERAVVMIVKSFHQSLDGKTIQ